MRNSVKLLSVVLLFAGFAGSLFYHPFSKTEVTRDPSSISETSVGELTELSNKSFTAYHYEREVKAVLKANAKPLIDLGLNGTVFVSEVSKTEKSRTVQIQFSLKQGKDSTLHESHAPFVVEIAKDQTITTIQTAKPSAKTDEDDFNVIKDFISLYAYGSNRDTTGIYQFKLSRNGNQIEKLKLKYESSVVPTTLVSSSTKATVEEKTGIWLNGAGTEEINVEAMGSTLTTISSFKIEKTTHPNLKPPSLMSAAVLQKATLDLVANKEVIVKPWSELKARLAAISTLSKPERLKLFRDLVKLLKSDPSEVAEFKKFIEDNAGQTGFMTFGIGVLATAGSPDAQAALRDWFAANPQSQHTVLNALITASVPFTDDTKTFLNTIVANRSTAADLAQNAVFAVGSELKQGDDPTARQTLLNYYASSSSESDRLNALDAMGNSGDPSFVPTLDQVIATGTISEQERAVYAARFMPAISAAPILLSAYNTGVAGMQTAAIRALQDQQDLTSNGTLIRECAGAGNSACSGYLARLNQ
jgi:hypothetical protein